MLDGINDADQHAKELIQLARLVRCKLNLILFNPFPVGPEALAFGACESLRAAPDGRGHRHDGAQDTGDDIDAACGQLAGKCATAPGSPSATPQSADHTN